MLSGRVEGTFFQLDESSYRWTGLFLAFGTKKVGRKANCVK